MDFRLTSWWHLLLPLGYREAVLHHSPPPGLGTGKAQERPRALERERKDPSEETSLMYQVWSCLNKVKFDLCRWSPSHDMHPNEVISFVESSRFTNQYQRQLLNSNTNLFRLPQRSCTLTPLKRAAHTLKIRHWRYRAAVNRNTWLQFTKWSMKHKDSNYLSARAVKRGSGS